MKEFTGSETYIASEELLRSVAQYRELYNLQKEGGENEKE